VTCLPTGSYRPPRPSVARTRPLWFALVLALASAVTLAFLFIPVLGIFVNTSVARLVSSLGNSESTDALRLSLETTAIAVAVIALVGTPAAYALATRSFPGKAVLVTVIELPLVLPPAVAGIALLAALGPNGILGGVLKDAHITLVFQTAGVVVAQVFVASPFYLRMAQTAFAGIDRSLLDTSRKDQQTSFSPRMLNRWPRRGLHAYTHLGGDNVTQRSLAQPWRPIEQDMINRLITTTRCLQQNAQVPLDLLLTDILIKVTRTQAGFNKLFLFAHLWRNEALLHSSLR